MTAPGRMPEPDLVRSPHTGWARPHWESYADALITGAIAHGTPGHARIPLPGAPSKWGPDSDALEGFTRTLLAAGFRLAGSGGHDPHGFADWFARGIATGTTPGHPEAWPRIGEINQVKVEAASLALVLSMTRPWIWDRLDPGTRGRVVDWLSPAVGADYLPNNWIWFQIVTETFLRSVGAQHDDAEIDHQLAVHESWARENGWYSDGNRRAYDHYSGWAMQLYPLLWLRMPGAQDRAAHFRDRLEARARDYLRDLVHLVGADGGPMLQGRSLVYRFAAAAPLWLDGWLTEPALEPGVVRRAASGIVRHFADRGVPGPGGVLELGWFGPYRPMAQAYSGPGSPYWAAKGLLGLALPADHPLWTATEAPLPVERGDRRRWLAAPGWAVSATAEDGIVRTANHGTDHGLEHDTTGDLPGYARLGYSTRTHPPVEGPADVAPSDQSVTLLDDAGTPTHRSGFSPLGAVELAGALAAGSRARVYRRAAPAGVAASPALVALVTTWSVLRGPWELRVVWVDPLPGERAGPGASGPGRLRISGWPVADAVPRDGGLHGPGLRSSVRGLLGCDEEGTGDLCGGNFLGATVSAAWAGTAGPVRFGVPYAALVTLTGAGTGAGDSATLEPGTGDGPAGPSGDGARTVRWPDGTRTSFVVDGRVLRAPGPPR